MSNYVESRRSMIEQNGFGLSMTQGTSMRPLIWGGRHCVAVAPLTEEPRRGDLLMFREARANREINIVHRLVEVVEEDGHTVYSTRGDNCLHTEKFGRDQIIGRVTEVHRLSSFRPWYVIPTRRFTVDGRAYRVYSRVWAMTWPVRRLYYLARAHANGLRVRLKRLLGR